MTDAPRTGDIVLVVEDSPDNLSMLTTALEQSGMTVLVAVDGASALELVTRIVPDVILMDAVMPGIDGFETTRLLKAESSLAHVPIIFMTGLSDTGHIVRGLEAGGVDYVTKPIDPDELVARSRVHLANARSAQSARAALDTTGRFLVALSAAGEFLWSTPQARLLLARNVATDEAERALRDILRDWLRTAVNAAHDTRSSIVHATAGSPLRFVLLSRTGSDEFLVRITGNGDETEEQALKQRLGLTAREADVLLWIARGKSNKDIADILGLSPRTVNKHLEGVYAKLGVENRASAAAIAVKALIELNR